LKAAGYEVEPYWPGLFANALEGVKVQDLLSNLGSGAAAPAPAAAAAAPAAAAADKGAAAAKKEEPKKPEKKAESEEEDMGFGNLHFFISSLPIYEFLFTFYILFQVYSIKFTSLYAVF
jgi:large subunit ribosomal protein LP1